MPNYDGTGPLNRGRVVGRGIGPCHHTPAPDVRGDEQPEIPVRDSKPACLQRE